MIKVNGVEIPTPSTYQPTLNDIGKADRNANGTMILEIITTKRKLEMSWSYLSQSDLAFLFQSIAGTFFTVEYPDPEDGTTKTGTFYKGDRSAGAIDYKDGVMRWKDCKVNFIER